MSKWLARAVVTDLADGTAATGHDDVIPLRRPTIGAQIRLVLRRDIISGRLLPRTMLSEQELSVRFGVSRTPIREALMKLAEEGLVEVYPQYGSFVAPIKLSDVFDSQFVREALECAAVEKAVERIDAVQDKQLKASLDRQRALHRAGDQEGFMRADENMHALIMKIAGHATTWNYVENAKAQMDRVRYLAMKIPRKQSAVLAEHAAVVDNLRARNRAGAVAAMRVHLRGIFVTIDILTAQKHNYFVDQEGGVTSVPSRTGSADMSGPAARRRTRDFDKSKLNQHSGRK